MVQHGSPAAAPCLAHGRAWTAWRIRWERARALRTSRGRAVVGLGMAGMFVRLGSTASGVRGARARPTSRAYIGALTGWLRGTFAA
jgi:hypothetical protein